MSFPKVETLKTAAEFQQHVSSLSIDLPFDEIVETGGAAPFAQTLNRADRKSIGNRFCILPMEGWDGTTDGRPSDLTRRRWQHFGRSGATLIWGGEAVAVRPDGRANPRQLVINDANLASLAQLRERLVAVHREHFGRTDDLYV